MAGNLTEKPYEIIMMNTEKSIGGRNWGISHYTLKSIPDFDKKLSLGDYTYQGDKLKIKKSEIEVECFNDKYVVSQNEIQTEYAIQQNNGIDVEDRIEKGKQIINDLLKVEI